MTTVTEIVTQTLWFFLPALIANMAPVFATKYNWVPTLNVPLDARITWHNKRLLGDHKTLRGLIVALIFGSITGYIQYQALQAQWVTADLLKAYTAPSAPEAFLFGALSGFGAMLGDAAKSFVKRRRNIPPGKKWIPWDQGDIVIGTLLVTQWITPLQIAHIVTASIVIPIVMISTSTLGVATKIKKTV